MKFSLAVALVVVLAIGTEAGSLVKRDAQTDLDKITRLINDMSASITSATQDMVEKVKALEVTNTAQTYSRTNIQPLVEKVQAEAAKLQEHVKPFIGNIEEQIRPITENFNTHIKPLTDNFHAQVKPLTDMMEKMFQQVMDQTKALMPPQ